MTAKSRPQFNTTPPAMPDTLTGKLREGVTFTLIIYGGELDQDAISALLKILGTQYGVLDTYSQPEIGDKP